MLSASENPLLKPELEQLVAEIVAINQAWKEARLIFGDSAQLTLSLRNLKRRSQIRLLRHYAPHQVYLKLASEALEADTNAEEGEPRYRLLLRETVNGVKEVAYLPLQVAQEMFSDAEIQEFIQV